MKRGRPRHKDVLTPREWQVIELLRQGLTNEALAERLGISLDTAKFHVSEILTKLGVSTRQEAARWPGEPKRQWAIIARVRPWPLSAPLKLVLVLLVLIGTVAALTGRLSGKGNSPEPAVPAGVDEAAQQLQLVVCYDDDTWKRPSIEEQAAHVNADPRYAPFDSRHGTQFAADFWAPPLGASPVGTVIEFSGLWTLGSDPDLVPAFSRICPVAGSNAGLDAVYIWLFGYEARSAVWAGDHLRLSVSSKPAGFEIVQVRLPGPITGGIWPAGPILFTASGSDAVGRIERGTIWSTRP